MQKMFGSTTTMALVHMTILLLLSLAAGSEAINVTVVSGDLAVVMSDSGELVMNIPGELPVRSQPLSVFVNGQTHTVANKGLSCTSFTSIKGSDLYGLYNGVELDCTADKNVPVVFKWQGYDSGVSTAKFVSSVSFPSGANGTNAQAGFQLNRQNPLQFVPFPAFNIEGALNSSAVLCYGADKAHMFSVSKVSGGGLGGADIMSGQKSSCFHLGNGPVSLLWSPSASKKGARAMVMGPASSFHLNYNTRVNAASSEAAIHDLSAANPNGICAGKKGTDFVCCDLSHINNVSSPAACCALCQTNPGCTAWKYNSEDPLKKCFLKTGTLTNPVKCPNCVVGTSGAPPSPSQDLQVWSWGVSGDVTSVPAGFTQSTLIVYTPDGLSAAWDRWGGAIRKQYNLTKRTDEDIFLTALSIWTDNGAATLGAGWHPTQPNVKPPPYTELGPNVGFMNWNWSMVDTNVLGNVADSVKDSGVVPRGLQLDCWWYPVELSSHPYWCVSDWVLPEEFYPNGTGGVRNRTGVPMILYFPALCPQNKWNNSTYTWAPGTSGFVVPIAEQSKRFWGDMFDYGASLASKSIDADSDPWPGIWAPPAVVEGWRGTNLAAYETDFYHNIVSQTPQLRQVLGAGEQFLKGINDACQERNMTAQLCAGNPPSFLEALTMPSITNARASIDYDWDGIGPASNNGFHNWAAPDNGLVFWATRIAPSKDNFWSSYKNMTDIGYHPDGKNGKDAELHALNALLLTGPVGLGDTCVEADCMTNSTLVQRLARADGILLKPDRPMAPMDVMFASLLENDTIRSMPGGCTLAQEKSLDTTCGSRLWQTHATVFPEVSSKAPELATSPTRRIVSHAGVDITERQSVTDALASTSKFLMQNLVVSVDQQSSFDLLPDDLYPRPDESDLIFWRSAVDGGKACEEDSDAVASGCVSLSSALPGSTIMDVSTKSHTCSQRNTVDGPTCLHSLGIWQVWPISNTSNFVILGDLGKYVSLSGYRFRLPPSQSNTEAPTLILVGQPNEVVPVTFLYKNNDSKWIVGKQNVTVSSEGRIVATLSGGSI